ncbi:SGNH/GDSL hydrolase family protein [Mucilaginibacter sp. SP1R1]|uniref:SGNH/GDSL hydrolase family protein n=1 Tax=Mucilaginibacter sp. SP1R1 TaxID=2723091 RepID=UPI00161971C6|nr:SGNH/GDSL hydrolase family protein [Mucilaginibacter sp. SP1R1]MBB6149495.1 hypothetical protein [Mucilaginibacter sp. SP1R1]
MAKVVKTSDLPLVTDLTGATIVGLTAGKTDAQFPLAGIVRNNIGSVKLTDAAPVGPLTNQSVDLIGTGSGSKPQGTYTNLLKAASTPIVIPVPATGNGIFGAKAKWNGTYWIPEWQELPLPATDLTPYTQNTDFVPVKSTVSQLATGNVGTDVNYNQVLTGVTGSGASYLAFNKPITNASTIKTIIFRLLARNEATQTFFTCSKSGSTFTVKQVFTVNVTAGTGVKTVDVSASAIPLDAGDYIFIVTNTNQVSFYNDGTAPNTLGMMTIGTHTTTPATGVTYTLGQTQATWSLDLQIVATELTKQLNVKNFTDIIVGAPANSVPSVALAANLDARITANTAQLPVDDIYSYNLVQAGPQNTATSWLGPNVITTQSGILKTVSLNIKAKNEGTQTLGFGSISGSNFTIEQIFTIPIAAAGVNTVDVSAQNIAVAAGKYIVLFNNTNVVGFYNSSPLAPVVNGLFLISTHGSPVVGSVVALAQNPTWQLDLAFTLVVKNLMLTTKSIDQTISNNSTRVPSSASVSFVKQGAQKGKDTILFTDKFAAISSEYTAISWGLVSGGVSPSAAGLNAYLQLSNRAYALAKRKARFEITFGADTVEAFYTRTIEGNGNQATMFVCDVPAGKMRLYNVFNSITNTMPTELSNANYAFVPGRKYLVEIVRNDDTNSIQVIDGLTGIPSAPLSDNTLGSGRQLDSYCIGHVSGAFPVLRSLTVSTPCQVMENEGFIGDSITEGLVLGASWANAWSYKLLAESSGFITGRPGGAIDGLIKRIESEIYYLRPRYVNVMIGTNGGDTVDKLTFVCNRLIEIGCIPLLHSIPWSSTSNSATVNAMVETVKANLGINGAYFDIATSVGYNNAVQDTTLFMGDVTHPNTAGNLNMYYSRKRWCPEVLY